MFIREMAQRTGISDDTLRFYERIGTAAGTAQSWRHSQIQRISCTVCGADSKLEG